MTMQDENAEEAEKPECETVGCGRIATHTGVGLDRGYTIISTSLCDGCYAVEETAGNIKD